MSGQNPTYWSVELPGGYPRLGPLDQLEKIIAEVKPDRIIVAMAERRKSMPHPPPVILSAQGCTEQQIIGTLDVCLVQEAT